MRYPGAPDGLPPLKALAAQPSDAPFARRFERARSRSGIVLALAAVALLAAAALVLVVRGAEKRSGAGPNTVAVISTEPALSRVVGGGATSRISGRDPRAHRVQASRPARRHPTRDEPT